MKDQLEDKEGPDAEEAEAPARPPRAGIRRFRTVLAVIVVGALAAGAVGVSRILNPPAPSCPPLATNADWSVARSFQGYVSGHSSFSRAAAEVMTGFTGSLYFPGGLSEWTIKAGSLKVEAGPSADVALQWATYYDASDQAGQSRLFGGIHVRADDFTGRIIGSTCGKDAWALAQRYYAGLASATN